MTLAALFVLAAPVPAQQWTLADFKELYRVEGSWEMKKSDLRIEETWVKKNDTLLESTAYEYDKEGRKGLQETVQLALSGNQILYIPVARNQNGGAPVIFKLVSNLKGRYVFENREHDFPQQIIYHFRNNNHIDASINGKTPRGFRQIDFPYQRVKTGS